MDNMLGSLKTDLLMADYKVCGKWWNFDINDPFNRIYYIDRGEGLMFVNGKKYRMQPGSFYCVPSYSDLKCRGGSKMGQFYMHFSAKIFSTIELSRVIEPIVECKTEKGAEIAEKFRDLLGIFGKKDLKSEFEGDTIVRYMLAFFLPAKTSVATLMKVEKFARFRPVIEFIEQNIKRPLSMEELAGYSGLSPVYFSNSFSKTFGMPPVKYVNLKRIEKSKLLLAGSDNKLETIAEAVGFTDSFYFSKTFKKYAGCNPSEYRKRVFYPSK